jgi:CHAT domain-containing protein/tetratricopeptide (TPR) repeat protein
VKILPSQAPLSFPAPGRAAGALLGSLALVLLGCALHPPRAAGPVAPAAPPAAETPGLALSPDAAVERRLAVGGRDEIALDLAAGRYARVSFETPGVDVAVSLLGPRGEAIATTVGSDLRLSLVTATAGRYRITVATPDSQDAVPYRLQLQESRPAHPGDGARVAAENALLQAKLLESEKKFPQAIAQAQDALSRWSTVPDSPSGRFDALYELGVLYDRSDNLDKDLALSAYRQALQLAEEAADRRGVAKAQVAIGLALFVHAEDDACLKLQAALPVLAELNDSYDLAEILFRLGIHHYHGGRYDQAEASYQQALRSAELANPQLVPGILNGLAVLNLSRGETKEARDQYRRALDLATREGNPRERAAALAGLGTVDRRLGKPKEALEQLSAALSINREMPSAVDEGRVLALLGPVHLDLGETDKAFEEFREAIEIFRSARDNGWLANTLGVLGNAELSVGRAQKALETYQEMLKVAMAANRDRQKGAALHGIGAAQRRLGQLGEAVQNLQRALTYRQGNDRLGEALTRQELGKAFQAQGDLGPAEESMRKSLGIADAVEAFLPQAAIHYDLALLERQEGNLTDAVGEIEQAVKILETVRSDLSEDRLRTSFFASRRSYYDLYVDLLMALDRRLPGQGYADRALAASEQARARGLLDLLDRLELTRGISPQLRQNETEAAARLSQIQSGLVEESLERGRPSVLEDLKLRLKEAEGQQRLIEERIQAESPLYYQVFYPSLLQRGEIQRLLDPGSALLEYFLGDEACYLFVVTRDSGLKVYALQLSKAEITEEAAKVRAAVESSGELSFAYRSAAYRLYRTLISPAEGPAGAGLAGKRLLIAADGTLNHLPFDALWTRLATGGAGDPYLIARYTTSYIPSASVLFSLSQQKAIALSETLPRFLAFAPVYGQPLARVAQDARREAPPATPLPALEGAEAEVRAIAARYPGKTKLYLGPEASLRNFKQGSLTAELVHFAGHGRFDEEHPESSGLLLADGVLKVADIFNLELSTRLVVLSACETAGKEVNGEGLVGLTRAFLYAGSPSVVVTLWRVADRKTSDLMVRFYANLDATGDEAQALRQAKLGLLGKGGRFAHPYYWAPFILVGKPG